MSVRRVYLDKTRESYCSDGLAKISNFTHDSTYHTKIRYNNVTFRNLHLSDSGNKMFMTSYPSGEVDEYHLTNPWDINTSFLYLRTPWFGNILESLTFNKSGTYLLLGAGQQSPCTAIKYTLNPPWDFSVTQVSQSIVPIVYYSGIGITHTESDFGWFYVTPSGFGRSNISNYHTPTLSGLSFEYNTSSSGMQSISTFGGATDDRCYLLYKEGSDFKINQYYWPIISGNNGYTQKVFYEDTLVLNNSVDVSGNVGDVNSFYIDHSGNNLFTLSSSGVVQKYQYNDNSHWYGSADSGNTIQNLFTQNRTGNNSISDYVDEGAPYSDNSDFWRSINSGISNFSCNVELPVIPYVDGVWLEVSYKTLSSGMRLEKPQLRSNQILSGFFSDVIDKSAALKLDITNNNSIYHVFGSGIGLDLIPLNLINSGIFFERPDHDMTLSFDLYSPISGNEILGINLLLSGTYLYDTGLFPLYIDGITTSNNNLDLFIDNHQVTGELDLFIHGYTNISGSISLFTEGSIELNDNIPLYISGNPVNDNIPLYIPGAFSTEHLDLYIYGYDTENSGLSLFIHGYEEISGDFPLYIHGITTQSDSLNLYLDAGELIPDSSNFPLFILATNNSGLYSTFPLSIGSDNAVDPTHNLNLFLGNNSTADLYGSMPLYLYNDNSSIKDLDLFIANYYTNISGSIPLYLFTENYGSGRAELPLFIARGSESLADVVPLFLKTTEVVNQDITMFIEGANSGINDSVNLYISGIDPIDLTMKLFTKGI